MVAKTLLISAFLLAGSALAAASGSCDDVFTAPLEPGRFLHIDSRSGNIDVFGTPESEVRVSCRLDDPTRAKDVRISLEGQTLALEGGPNQGVHIRIYIPQRTNLKLGCPAGNVTVTDVEGDKELKLRAGNLTVKGARRADYSRLEASVTAGNVNAPGFGGDKSGLFRSFTRNNTSGKYRLKAHVSAGNITIR